jgi:hypothetical protein
LLTTAVIGVGVAVAVAGARVVVPVADGITEVVGVAVSVGVWVFVGVPFAGCVGDRVALGKDLVAITADSVETGVDVQVEVGVGKFCALNTILGTIRSVSVSV